MTSQFPGKECSKVSLIVRRNRVEISAQKSRRFDVAPVLDFPGALGRVKGSLAALAAVAPLTRPARSRGWQLPERRALRRLRGGTIRSGV